MKPSEIIDKKVEETEYDYRSSCGANNCECYTNSIKIDAIIEYLDEQQQLTK
jgi:hypothetical protein